MVIKIERVREIHALVSRFEELNHTGNHNSMASFFFHPRRDRAYFRFPVDRGDALRAARARFRFWIRSNGEVHCFLLLLPAKVDLLEDKWNWRLSRLRYHPTFLLNLVHRLITPVIACIIASTDHGAVLAWSWPKIHTLERISYEWLKLCGLENFNCVINCVILIDFVIRRILRKLFEAFFCEHEFESV